MISFTRVNSPGGPWILTVILWRLQVRIGNYQRAIWWRRKDGEFSTIYNSWRRGC